MANAGVSKIWEIACLKIYSEYFPIKYLFSDEGLCLGLDTKRCSFLFLASKSGLLFRRRPVGDKVVENLNYDIHSIEAAIRREEYWQRPEQ